MMSHLVFQVSGREKKTFRVDSGQLNRQSEIWSRVSLEEFAEEHSPSRTRGALRAE